MATVNMNIPDKLRQNLLEGTNTIDFEYSGTPAGAVIRCLVYESSTITQ